MKIFPSPTSPVRAAPTIASTAAALSFSDTHTRIDTFGTNPASIFGPRYRGPCPICLPNPRTSSAVAPTIPFWTSAAFTASSRLGLKIASIINIEFSVSMPSPAFTVSRPARQSRTWAHARIGQVRHSQMVHPKQHHRRDQHRRDRHDEPDLHPIAEPDRPVPALLQ